MGSPNGATPGNNCEPEDVVWLTGIGDPVGVWPESGAPCGADTVEAP